MPLLVPRFVEVPAYRKNWPWPGVWAARLRAAAASAATFLAKVTMQGLIKPTLPEGRHPSGPVPPTSSRITGENRLDDGGHEINFPEVEITYIIASANHTQGNPAFFVRVRTVILAPFDATR